MGGRAGVPARIAWAVELLDVAPDDRILEFGCGPGVAVSLVCQRLGNGRITAIDRSAAAVRRALARNAACVEAGRAVVEQVELARFAGDAGRFDKAFAINVNVFWTGEARAECEVLARVLRPGGVVRLVYAGPAPRRRDGGPGCRPEGGAQAPAPRFRHRGHDQSGRRRRLRHRQAFTVGERRVGKDRTLLQTPRLAPDAMRSRDARAPRCVG